MMNFERPRREESTESTRTPDTPSVRWASRFLKDVHGRDFVLVREETAQNDSLVAFVFCDPLQEADAFHPVELVRVVPKKGGGWEIDHGYKGSLTADEAQRVLRHDLRRAA